MSGFGGGKHQVVVECLPDELLLRAPGALRLLAQCGLRFWAKPQIGSHVTRSSVRGTTLVPRAPCGMIPPVHARERHSVVMTLTLDPRYPLVWRTPNSLQLGVDNPPVVLDSVTLGHERMLAGLAVGLTPAGLLLIGTESGLTSLQIGDFHAQIQPALATPRETPHAQIAVSGIGPTVDRLGWRLTEAGLESHATGPRPEAAAEASCSPDLAIVVGHYVLDPEFRGVWLRRDVPHLPIVYGDTSVTIGPTIEPGFGPCLYCLELHHRDSDPAWPALAIQLLGTHSTAESPFLASEVATLATRMALRRLDPAESDADHGHAHAAPSLTLDAITGEQTWRVRSRHPECGCEGIASTSALGLQGIGSANSHPNVDLWSLPRTSEAVSVPA